MAIYRFEDISGHEIIADRLIIDKRRMFAGGYAVSDETLDRLLSKMEANEAGGAGDGWKPASEPPGSMRDVVVQSHSGKTGIGYFTSSWFVYQVDTGSIRATDVSLWHELPKPPASPPQPELPKEPEPVWQGPGWYRINDCSIRFLFKQAGDQAGELRAASGGTYTELFITRLIRLATDKELRHVCTHGTEPDSRPEVG